MISYEQYLRRSAIPKETIDVFLDPTQPTWARFDPLVGYVLGNYLPRDGIDGCSTISTAGKNGARTPHHYTDRPCRIHTYGNSFTQCHQVSDGETWQEYLAAHLGEPIRNFGMGGFGVYQAYRRMLRVEASPDGAEYVILYIWGDDHTRSVLRCRHALIYPWWDHQGGHMFHCNFWANLEIDLASGRFVEKENRLPTPASLYRMADPDFMVAALRDDLMLQLLVADQVDPTSLDLPILNALAGILGVEALDPHTPESWKASTTRLAEAYGFAASRYIVEQAASFCHAAGKHLMISLLCPGVTRQLLNHQPRYDQAFVDWLATTGLPYFDMNVVHLQDYQAFNLPVEDYLRRYFIGHYSPAGNHFFAFSIKDSLVDWLDPKPITYREGDSRAIDFKGYLPERA